MSVPPHQSWVLQLGDTLQEINMTELGSSVPEEIRQNFNADCFQERSAGLCGVVCWSRSGVGICVCPLP